MPNKSGGFIQIRFCPGERGAFVGRKAAEPAVHLPRSLRRQLRRQRQQLAQPPAPAPADGASTALNAPFDGICQGPGQGTGLRAAGHASEQHMVGFAGCR